MRALIQRVSQASVTVDGQITGAIERGLLVLLGIGREDGEAQVKMLVDKIVQLRIFEDEAGKMNRSLLDIQGELLIVSQFTLYADVRKGRRPSFISAAPPDQAIPLYEQFKQVAAAYGVRIASGIFGADMKVSLLNDGPVTIWLDTEELK
jgi:D-tyrosyl-tRNA(Tyr) deacylase